MGDQFQSHSTSTDSWDPPLVTQDESFSIEIKKINDSLQFFQAVLLTFTSPGFEGLEGGFEIRLPVDFSGSRLTDESDILDCISSVQAF